MSTVAKSSGGTDFAPVPAGNHRARCYSVIDLGTQQVEWQKQVKFHQKVRIQWELADEKITTDKGELPMIIGATFTNSLAETSKLRPFLEAWRTKKFTEEELAGFDIAKLIGTACLLNVVHNTKDGKVYANVASASPMPKGMPQPPPLVNPKMHYQIEQGKDAVFQSLPEWLRKQIEKCEEWQQEEADKKAEHSQPDHEEQNPPLQKDDIPF